MIDAAIAADMSLKIKSIPVQGLNVGPLTKKAEGSLSRNVCQPTRKFGNLRYIL